MQIHNESESIFVTRNSIDRYFTLQSLLSGDNATTCSMSEFYALQTVFKPSGRQQNLDTVIRQRERLIIRRGSFCKVSPSYERNVTILRHCHWITWASETILLTNQTRNLILALILSLNQPTTKEHTVVPV